MYILFYMLLAALLGTIRFAAWTYPVLWSKIIAKACKMIYRAAHRTVTVDSRMVYGRKILWVRP